MTMQAEQKKEIVTKFGANEWDTGSSEVQIALLSGRITYLTEHFKVHKKDTNSRRGLLKLVGHRRRLLKYMQRTNLGGYRELIENLGIRK